ncbi:MAG: polysaccharide deacetylase [Oscillospiraceae bacterium]|nr:polysaccharide deacetylase [Oscillospiraceae bacterium]
MKGKYIAVKLKIWALPIMVLALSTVFALPVLKAEKADANAIKTVYFTFDDGPSAVTEEILDILKREGIKATFFVIGPSGEKTDERLYRIAAEGHSIGLHSMSHDYDKIYAFADAFIWDLEYERSWIYSVTGIECNIFRFPGGSDNAVLDKWLIDEIKEKAEEKGFIWYDWNADGKDSLGTLLSAEQIAENVLSSDAVAAGGDVIVLMHDSSTRKTAPEALEILIEEFRAMGYGFGKLG